MSNIDTGLNDKNGNRIKAGDLIRNKQGDTAKVFYNPKQASFYQEIVDYAYGSILRPGERYQLIGPFTVVLDNEVPECPDYEIIKADKVKSKEVNTEDMIAYWDCRGSVLAKVIFTDKVDLEHAEEYLYPAMMDVFGKDGDGDQIVNNSSYEFTEEWK